MTNFSMILFFITSITFGQTEGCMDKLATNYNPKATIDNNKCLYDTTEVRPIFTSKISDSLTGTSGLLFYDDLLWTQNDHFDSTFYGLDLKGEIKKKINIPTLKTKDWEAISQDSLYLYVGDFGNNITGNRKDLRIIRIQKQSFYSGNPIMDTISFSYSNQEDFDSQKTNSSDFDCEAFVVVKDSIYLFTKQWTTNKSSVYSLPKTPGTYVAQLKETIDTRGLITDATTLPDKKGVVLCGYTKFLQPFLLLLYDYQNEDFGLGKIRKIKLDLPFHQVEAITTRDGLQFYITNESTIKKPFVNTVQQMHIIDLSAYLKL